jgi:hypothetical protein
MDRDFPAAGQFAFPQGKSGGEQDAAQAKIAPFAQPMRAFRDPVLPAKNETPNEITTRS